MRFTVSVGISLNISGIRPDGIKFFAALLMILRNVFSSEWTLLVVGAVENRSSVSSLNPSQSALLKLMKVFWG